MLHYYYRIGLPIVISITVSLFVASNTLAGDAPGVGFLYNTKETHSLTYRCQQNTEAILECDFVQTSVRKKEKPEDLKTSLRQARDEFRNGVKFTSEECKAYSELLDILEGRRKPPKEDKFNKIREIEKRDLIESTKAMTQFCKNKTEDNYLKLIQLNHEKNMRTCLVSSITFKQTFRYIQDNVSGLGIWVAKGDPVGPCGVVQLSRFELEQPKGNIPIVFWKYIARKAITNPQGFIVPGASCKGLDESEYLYDWRSKEHQLSCDYIEFSAL